MSVTQHHSLVVFCLLAVVATTLSLPHHILQTSVPLCVPVIWSAPALDTDVFGGNAQPTVDSLEDCQTVCELTLTCVGIDWNPWNGVGQRCFTILTRTGIRNNGTASGITHYDVIARNNCTALCSDTWNDGLANTNVLGGTAVPSADSVEACKAACGANSACTGVDWNPSNIAGLRCFAVIPPTGPRNIGTALGITHYDIIRNSCTGGGPLVSAFPSVPTGSRSSTVVGASTTSTASSTTSTTSTTTTRPTSTASTTTKTTTRPSTTTKVCQKILIQQHVDASAFFNRTWSEYKVGFGSTSGNYWLGNEQLHTLTQDNKYKVRFELQSNATGLWYWAEYDTFTVGDESTQYRLTIGGFHGNISWDTMTLQINLNGRGFSTKDRDNDNMWGCAQSFGGGFWYNGCGQCNVNAAGIWYFWYCMGSIGNSCDSMLRTSRMWLVCR